MVKGDPQPLGRPPAEDRGYGLDGEAEGDPRDLTFFNADGDRATIYAEDLAVVGEMLIKAHVRHAMRRRS